jgi:lipid-A-disaccharide synthase-like uncharacterized protein
VSVPLLVPFLALQVWDAFGWVGQGVFTWRTVEQWISSEKARRVVVPATFWAWSLAGSVFLLVYAVYRREPVYLLGTLVNGCLFARNYRLSRRGAAPVPGRRALWPAALGVVLFAAIVVEAVGPNHGLVRFDYALLWLAVGFAGQAFWIGRLVLQSIASERVGRPVLPASYFWCSVVGALLLFAYAIYRVDWVNMAAYGPNVIPYARNLLLLRRRRASDGEGGGGSGGTTGPAPSPERASA